MIRILILILFLGISKVYGETSFFQDGKVFFENKDFEKAKFKIEQDIVFNPKSEKSYLYLSKIFNKEKKIDLAKINLETVLLINPKNEEAVFDLMKIQIKKSNFSEVKKNLSNFKRICKNLCFRKIEIEQDLKNFKN